MVSTAIGVLGPLTVEGAAAGLSPRDRVVLAALALHPGEVTSAERLADALWGEQPPASWNKVVPGCVMRLRRVLGPDAIETVADGYRLVVSGEAVDAQRFERLVGRARELLTLGEPERAAHLATEALGLWRGRPLGDLDRWDAGRIEAARLEELRLDAEELRLDASLRAGRYRDVLAEAQTRVAEAPLRERRWALLATAQYQAGRQGEALRTLHRARLVLAIRTGDRPRARVGGPRAGDPATGRGSGRTRGGTGTDDQLPVPGPRLVRRRRHRSVLRTRRRCHRMPRPPRDGWRLGGRGTFGQREVIVGASRGGGRAPPRRSPGCDRHAGRPPDGRPHGDPGLGTGSRPRRRPVRAGRDAVPRQRRAVTVLRRARRPGPTRASSSSRCAPTGSAT